MKIEKYYSIALVSLIILILLIMVIKIPMIVNESYKYDNGYITVFSPSDMLGYCASALSFFGTIILGIITVYLTKRSNALQEEININQNSSKITALDSEQSKTSIIRFELDTEFCDSNDIANFTEPGEKDNWLFCLPIKHNDGFPPSSIVINRVDIYDIPTINNKISEISKRIILKERNHEYFFMIAIGYPLMTSFTISLEVIIQNKAKIALPYYLNYNIISKHMSFSIESTLSGISGEAYQI